MRLASILISVSIVACGSDGPHGERPPQQIPPHTVGGFRIELPPITLAPGEELEPCFVFPLVVTGPSSVVGGAKLVAQQGMHHGNITARPSTGTGMRPCTSADGDPATDILAGGSVLFASSTQVAGDEWYSFPDGVGYRVRATHEIVARMHYLNPSEGPITVAPTYEWFTIDEAALTHEMAPFAWAYKDFTIPAGAELTVTGDCRYPAGQSMHVVTMLPHMHKLGTALSVEYKGGARDGEPILDSAGYDPGQGVLRQYDPAVDLSVADGVRFSCTWVNTLDRTVSEGIGDNEMCIVFGYAWPLDQAYSSIATASGCLSVPAPQVP